MERKSKIVKLDTLLLDDDNARIHNRKNLDAIKSSIQKFGQYRPFVVDKNTGKIAVGNGMLIAMKELGFTEGSALFVDLSDEDFRLLSIADNRSCDMSKEDPTALLSRLKSIPDELRDLTGYSPADIAILSYDATSEELEKKEYDKAVKTDDNEGKKFVFSVLHFDVSARDYEKWVKRHGFDEMDEDEVCDRLKIMLGVENE